METSIELTQDAAARGFASHFDLPDHSHPVASNKTIAMNILTVRPKGMLMTLNVQRVAIRLSVVAAVLVVSISLVSCASALRPVMQVETTAATASTAEAKAAESASAAATDPKMQKNAVQGTAIGIDPLPEPTNLDRPVLSSPSDKQVESMLQSEDSAPKPMVDHEVSSVETTVFPDEAPVVPELGMIDVPYNEYYWQYEKERLAKAHELRVRRAQFQSYSRLLRTERNLWLGYEPLRPSWPTPPQNASRYSHINRIMVPIYTYIDGSY